MKRVISIAITVIFLMGMLPAQPAAAVLCRFNLEVTNTDDSGAGSLRQALLAACPGDTITFNPSLSGLTILLSSGQLIIDRDLTIDGSALASRVTITTDNMGRVLWVNSGVTATLNSLRITHGNVSGNGAGINNLGNLTVINSVLLNNLAGQYGGGIYNSGTLAVINSSFVINSGYYGGGILNNGGAVTVTNSSFNENGASQGGGGIYNAASGGNLTVSDSTFTLNTSSAGGGIASEAGTVTTIKGSTLTQNSTNHPFGSGGGLLNGLGAMMTVANTTLTENIALQYGGGIANYGTMTLKNSTLSGNSGIAFGGGGLANYNGTVHYANTIIANSPTGGDCANINSGQFLTNTNNLVEDGSCGASLSGDPMLVPLANNGGPTQTMALLAGSPAIDTGDDATCAAAPVSGKDQRGIFRPMGAHCDIGAYEKALVTIFLPMIYR